MILIDLQKEFDTIDHELLLEKMIFLGFSEEVIDWFRSYLSNRNFKVNINKAFSEYGEVTCGVPQGSILGPLLFLLYVNDMPQALSCDLLLYADDSCLIFQHKDVKEIEKVLNQNFSDLCDWFVDNKLSIHFGEDKFQLFKFQSGFRPSHSTDTCLSFLNDKILKGFDSGLLTGMILIDLQKAFDTIDHDILFTKMKYLGFSNHTINWFKSYFANRTFKVNVNNVFSNPGYLTCGVPQGSILGPLLFLLYINDMPQAVSCDLFLYADDSCLVYQDKDIKVIERRLNTDFSNLCDWFVDNKLSIHFGQDKTKSILFSSKNKIKNLEPLNISYQNINIKQHSKVKYLGCIFDATLSGESMAQHVTKKINSKLRFLYRNNRILSQNLKRLLCNA